MKYLVKFYDEKTKDEKKNIIIDVENVQKAREFAHLL